MAKQDTPAQHDILHYLWPNNCCLCGHEAEIAVMKKQVDELKLRIIELVLKDTIDVGAE